MFSQITEVKLLLNNDNLDNIYSAITFTSLNLNNKNSLCYYLIGDNLFDNFDNFLLPIIKFIKDTNIYHRILIQYNGLDGNEEQFKILKESNVNLYIVNKQNIIPEEQIQLILKYFPLTNFNFYLNYEQCNILTLWNYYRKFENIFNLNFLIDDIEINDQFFTDLDNQLNQIDDIIINTFDIDKKLPIIPDFYRYMFWKIGAKDYILTSKTFKTIPENINGIRCGQGCSKKLTITADGDVYTCYKSIDERFKIGNIFKNNYLDEMALNIENILKTTFEEEIKNQVVAVESNEKCHQCELYTICTRGCLPINCLNTGKYLTPTNNFCSWNQIFYNHSLKIISHFNLYKNNELFKEYYLGSIIKGEKYNVC